MGLFSTTQVTTLSDIRDAISSALTSNGWSRNGNIYNSGNLVNVNISQPEVVNESKDYQRLGFRFGTGNNGSDVTGGPIYKGADTNTSYKCYIMNIIQGNNLLPAELYIYYYPENNSLFGVISSGLFTQFFCFGEYDIDVGGDSTGVFYHCYGSPRTNGQLWDDHFTKSNVMTCYDGSVVGQINSAYITGAPYVLSYVSSGAGARDYMGYSSTGVYMGDDVTNLVERSGYPTGGWALNSLSKAQYPVACSLSLMNNLLASSKSQSVTGFPQLIRADVSIRGADSSDVGDDAFMDIGSIENIRFLAINNLSSGEVITYGEDSWQCWPILEKSDVGFQAFNLKDGTSGYMGMAFKL